MRIRVDRINKADTPQIVGLASDTLPPTWGGDSADRLSAWLIESQSLIALAARLESSPTTKSADGPEPVVGFVLLEEQQHGDRAWRLAWVGVDSGYRRNGIGRFLVHTALEPVCVRSVRADAREHPDAVPFLGRVGFRTIRGEDPRVVRWSSRRAAP